MKNENKKTAVFNYLKNTAVLRDYSVFNNHLLV
jgi:hypothetical protein